MPSPQTVEAGARAFGLDPSELSPMSGRHGFIGSIQVHDRPQGQRLLKLSPRLGGRPLIAYDETMTFINWLADHGLSVSRRHPSPQGNLVEEVVDDESGQAFAVSYFDRAPGHAINPDDPVEWDDPLFVAMGRYLGQFHNLSRVYPHWRSAPEGDENPADPNGGFCHLPDPSARFRTVSEISRDPEILDLHYQWLAKRKPWPEQRACWGIAHGDFCWTNLVRDGDRLTLVDWDQTACAPFCQDLRQAIDNAYFAQSIQAFYRGEVPPAEQAGPKPEKNAFARRFATNLLEGYSQVAPLPDEWVERLPEMVGYKPYMYLFALYAAGHDPRWQPYLAANRECLVQGVPILELKL